MIITLELIWAIIVALWWFWPMLILLLLIGYAGMEHEDGGDKRVRKAREKQQHREAKVARIRKKLEDKPLSKGWHKLDDLPVAKPKPIIKPKPFPMQGIAEGHAEEMTRRKSGCR